MENEQRARQIIPDDSDQFFNEQKIDWTAIRYQIQSALDSKDLANANTEAQNAVMRSALQELLDNDSMEPRGLIWSEVVRIAKRGISHSSNESLDCVKGMMATLKVIGGKSPCKFVDQSGRHGCMVHEDNYECLAQEALTTAKKFFPGV